MNGIKIFGQNWLDENCTITASSGSGTASYLYDQQPVTQWTSEGSSDAVGESLELTLKNWQGVEVERDINRIVLLNHNFKACSFDYWNGSAWVELTAAALANCAVANSYISLAAPIATSRVRVRPTTTQVANAEKALGELKLCLGVLDGTQLWRSELARHDEQRAGNYRTGDGRLVFWREWTKYASSGTIYDVTLADYQLLLPYLTTAALLTIVLYDDHDPTACYEVALVTPPAHSINRKTALYEISLDLMER